MEVPNGISDADPTVIVTTSANVSTDKFPVAIVGSLAIIGVKADSTPRPNDDISLIVEGLPNKADKVRVRFGDHVTEETSSVNGVVSVRVPATLEPGSTDVKIGVNGRWSDSFSVNVKP